MKRDLVTKFWVFLCVNLWYLPLFAFLLGVKIILISMLVDSVSVHRRMAENPLQKDLLINRIRETALVPETHHRNDTHKGSANLGWQNNLKMSHQPLTSEDWRLLERIEEATILPSPINRAFVFGLPDKLYEINACRLKIEFSSIIPRSTFFFLLDTLSHFWTVWVIPGHLAALVSINPNTKLRPISPHVALYRIRTQNVYYRISGAKKTDKDSIWVVLNQVPWGGGDVIDNLLLELQEQNSFKHLQHEYRTPWPRFLLEEEQKSLVTWFEYQHLPRSYDRHFYFVNFTKYQQYVFENPIYINMVQDPLARIRLAFLWKRSDKIKAEQEVNRRNEIEEGSGQEWLHKDFEGCVLKADPECSYEDGSQDFTLMVPFFCGQVNACVTINNRWALQMAKFNIEKYYSVVGVFERLQESLYALENYIPRFFSGASLFDPEKIQPDPPPVSLEVQEIIKEKLRSEYELYDFIEQRLQQQISFLSQISKSQAKIDSNDLK